MKKYLWGFCSILLSSLVLAFPVAHQARAATSKASTRVTTKKKTDAKKTKSKKQNQREALSAGFSASEALMMSQKRFNFVLSTSASRGLDEFADTYFSDISFSTSYRLNTWSALSLSIAYNTIALNSDGDLFNNEVNQPDIYGFSNLSVGWSVPGIYRSKSKKTSINYFASLTAPTSRVSQRASMIGGLGNGIVMRYRPFSKLITFMRVSARVSHFRFDDADLAGNSVNSPFSTGYGVGASYIFNRYIIGSLSYGNSFRLDYNEDWLSFQRMSASVNFNISSQMGAYAGYAWSDRFLSNDEMFDDDRSSIFMGVSYAF